MNKRCALRNDEVAAATELSYVFTFMLGVLLLSVFSLSAIEIESATKERWNDNAIGVNLDDIAEAIERADAASLLNSNSTYMEEVTWRGTEADPATLSLKLTQHSLILHDSKGIYSTETSVSGIGKAVHQGELSLYGSPTVWVIYSNGTTSISLEPIAG